MLLWYPFHGLEARQLREMNFYLLLQDEARAILVDSLRLGENPSLQMFEFKPVTLNIRHVSGARRELVKGSTVPLSF